MICDYARVADGKLDIIGGGWAYLWAAEEPAMWAIFLAVNLSVPWARTNQDLEITARLLTEDHEPVLNDADEAVQGGGNLRVGRPPTARPGVSLVVPFVLPFGLSLNFGGYVFEISEGQNVVTRVPFQVARRAA